MNNRRFTILSGPGERRNLASECLGLVARELPRLWLKKFLHRPLLAETFCDIERTAGTCYKAAGWIPLGQTQGFTRVNRQDCDFYVPNGRPKAVWVKPLGKDALELLNARTLPEDCAEGAQGDARGVMPLGTEGYESLYDALCHVHDTRDSNRTFPIGGMLAIVVMAMMSGANPAKAIARFAKRLTMAQRGILCMPHAKSAAGVVAKHEYKVPSYATLYNFLRTLDLDDFGERLSGWMASQGDGTLPRQLALDGKFVKEAMGVCPSSTRRPAHPSRWRPARARRARKAGARCPSGGSCSAGWTSQTRSSARTRSTASRTPIPRRRRPEGVGYKGCPGDPLLGRRAPDAGQGQPARSHPQGQRGRQGAQVRGRH